MVDPNEIMYRYHYSVAKTVVYDDGESEPDWLCVDSIGFFPTREEANKAAKNLARLYSKMGLAANYCEAHVSDGLTFDVVLDCENAVDSYEVTAAGKYEEWHDEECHEATGWKVV